MRKMLLLLVLAGVSCAKQPSVKVLYQIGTALPATCQQGQFYYKTNATDGKGFYICQTADTWVLQSALGTDTTPVGTVAFFNLSGCPAGWSEYTAARGRYVVGLPGSGTLAGTGGTAMTNLEARAAGIHGHTASQAAHTHAATNAAHTHSVTDPGHAHSIIDPGHLHTQTLMVVDTGSVLAAGTDEALVTYPTTWNTGTSATGIGMYAATTGVTNANATPAITVPSATPAITVVDGGSVAGTNAPYIQLLSCKKD